MYISFRATTRDPKFNIYAYTAEEQVRGKTIHNFARCNDGGKNLGDIVQADFGQDEDEDEPDEPTVPDNGGNVSVVPETDVQDAP